MHTRRLGRLAARTFLAGALVAGVAACGDDDDDTAAVDAPAGDGEQAAGGGDDAFCAALVEFNAAIPEVDLEDATADEAMAAHAQLEPLWAPIRDGAPEDVRAEVDQLDPSIEGLAEGDAEAFNADETFETYQVMVGKAIPSCDFETVSVTAVDYAFEGVPETLPAGTLAFEFENASDEEEHEMVVFKKNDPSQSTEELFELPEEEAMAAITFAGFAFASPGDSSSSLISFDEPGDYTMVCFIPVGGGEEGPPHFTQGMVAEFTVQ